MPGWSKIMLVISLAKKEGIASTRPGIICQKFGTILLCLCNGPYPPSCVDTLVIIKKVRITSNTQITTWSPVSNSMTSMLNGQHFMVRSDVKSMVNIVIVLQVSKMLQVSKCSKWVSVPSELRKDCVNITMFPLYTPSALLWMNVDYSDTYFFRWDASYLFKKKE